MGTFFCMFKDRCTKCNCYGVYPEAMCPKCEKVLIPETESLHTYHFNDKGAENEINNQQR